MSNDLKHVSSDLQLALRAQAVQADDFDPELLYPGVEEEEEEEEEDPDDEPGDDDGEEDRGDDVDPALTDDDESDAAKDDNQEEEEELDPEALAELAGDGGKAKMVPHARFNEVNETLKQERAARLLLEEELARTKGQVPAPAVEKPGDTQAYDFDAAEDRYMDAILEGDKDLAKSIRAEIRTEEKKQYSEQTAQTAQKAADTELKKRDAESEQAETQKVLTVAITKYPFLNHQGEEADAEAIEEVIARRDLYMKQGMSLSKALATAVEKVAPRYAPQEQEPEKPKGKKVASVEQIERNLEREKRIPSAMPGVGERGKDIDYANLSEDEFDALPDAEKRKARGDFVSEKD
jgi:hypothetical protein